MANVEDPERIRIALNLLQGQFAARKLTSHVIDPQKLGITFHTDDKQRAAEYGRAIDSIAQETTRVFGLDAEVRGPVFVPGAIYTEGIYSTLVTIRANGSSLSCPQPVRMNDCCIW